MGCQTNKCKTTNELMLPFNFDKNIKIQVGYYEFVILDEDDEIIGTIGSEWADDIDEKISNEIDEYLGTSWTTGNAHALRYWIENILGVDSLEVLKEYFFE